MPFFTAQNVEPEEDYVEVVDNTREIQLEEAFKLYSTALRLHAQGKKFHEEAAKAYDELFQCEIIKQYEKERGSIDEGQAIESLEPVVLDSGAYLQVSEDDGLSTLPQLLYLAYKNHGQFLLDRLKVAIKAKAHPFNDPVETTAILQKVLERFTMAIEQDESDTELWRRTARVGQVLGSKAIERFCFEAAVEVDDDPANEMVEPATLEEAYSGNMLNLVLSRDLHDSVALTHPIMEPYQIGHINMRTKMHHNAYHFLSNVNVVGVPGIVCPPQASFHVEQLNIGTTPWQATADAISRLYPSDDPVIGSDKSVSPGFIVKFQIPDADVTMGGTEERPRPVVEIVSPKIVKAEITQTPIVESPAESAPEASDGKAAEEVLSPKTAAHKRTLSAAGLPEAADEDSGRQQRSKRMTTRKRETLGAEPVEPIDPLAENKAKYEGMGIGDQYMFEYTQGLLKRLDVDVLGAATDVKACVDEDNKSAKDVLPENVAIQDLKVMVGKWNQQLQDSYFAANGLQIMCSGDELRQKGLNAFIEDSKTESMKAQAQAPTIPPSQLTSFIKTVNEHNWTIDEIGYNYFKALTMSYRYSLWPPNLKQSIMHLIILMGPSLERQLEQECCEAKEKDKVKYSKLEETAQMLLELHLDLFVEISKTTSTIGIDFRSKQKSRLDRCYELVQRLNGDSMNSESIWRLLHITSAMTELKEDGVTELCAGIVQLLKADSSKPGRFWRNVWASFKYFSLHQTLTREFMICCWTALRRAMLDADPDMKIILNNNAAMPEVSIAAADRELSILTTMDAFLNVFENITPIQLIERVEPVVDDQSKYISNDGETDGAVQPVQSYGYAQPMRTFLENKGPALRLYLWQRLRDAYQQIDYPTKVFSCHLRSIEIIIDYIKSPKFKETPEPTRHTELLGYLKVLDDLLVKALTIALNDQTAFDIIDENHLKQSIQTVASVSRFLHGTSLINDQADAGLLGAKEETPANGASPARIPPTKFLRKVSDTVVRSWALLYTLIREAVKQKPDLFKTANDDLAEYLAVVHYSLGLRKRCDHSNKIFLKMMKIELIKLKFVDKWEDYLGQVMYDLYGLKLGDKVGVWELGEHDCEKEKLDRRTAQSIIDHVIVLAHRMSMKDLQKDELRHTIEKMQNVIGPAKSTTKSAHNFRIINDFLKSTINPLELNKSLKGLEFIDTQPVKGVETHLAEKGWYFLIGYIALCRFRSVKRTAPGGTDDLRLATNLLKTQLQYTPENWEAWYRLAQCFDSELEEEVLWSSEKINDDKAAIALTQRSAIHCYSMAVSCAIRTATPSFETAEKMSALYSDYGMRLYASSREPFSMEAFFTDGLDRHMSGPPGVGMYRIPIHHELNRYKCWRLAAHLFTLSLREKPNNWHTHYMLGKCLWKQFMRWDSQAGVPYEKRPLMATLISTLEKAVQYCPKPRDSRVEPILEPHYKIVSVLHKLVMNGHLLLLQDAADRIQRGRYAIKKGARIDIPDHHAWFTFVSDSIKHLRGLDKSNWQHRFIYRSAILSLAPPDHLPLAPPEGQVGHPPFLPQLQTPEAAAKAVKIMTSGIFSKTMVVSVWKPELERAGRHCVYMSRYVHFMLGLQYTLGDKAGMEMLGKRVRRRGTEYFAWERIWEAVVLCFVRLCRVVGGVGEDQEGLVRRIDVEEVEGVADALESWAEKPEASEDKTFEALREGVELRKTNAGLMRAMPIDDLVADAYSMLIYNVGRHLPRPPKAKPDTVTITRPAAEGVVASIEGAPAGQVVEVIENVRKIKHPTKREILRRAEVLATRFAEAQKPGTSKSESRRAETAARRGSGGGLGKVSRTPTVVDDDDQEEQDEHVEEQEEQEEHEEGEGEGGYDDVGADDEEQGGEEDEEEADDDGEERHTSNRNLNGDRSQRSVDDGDDADNESDLSDAPDHTHQDDTLGHDGDETMERDDTIGHDGDAEEDGEEEDEGDESDEEDNADEAEEAETEEEPDHHDDGATPLRQELRAFVESQSAQRPVMSWAATPSGRRTTFPVASSEEREEAALREREEDERMREGEVPDSQGDEEDGEDEEDGSELRAVRFKWR